jgi:hypothetical protein
MRASDKTYAPSKREMICQAGLLDAERMSEGY